MNETTLDRLINAASAARDDLKAEIADETLNNVLRIGIRNQFTDDRKVAKREILDAILQQARLAKGGASADA